MNTIVIYPGRFHPFHRGHKASYDYLTKKYGENNVYIATSDPAKKDPITSPFSYSDKVKMMTKLGVPAGRIVQVKNPYQAKEIVDQLTPEERADTALIFAVSAKDAERFSFAPKKNGEASYLQPLPEKGRLKPMTQQGYVAITPTVNFRVQGQDADSATAVRKLYVHGNDADRDNIIVDLYGDADSELRAIFDQRLGADKPAELIRYGTPIVSGGNDDPGMRESRVNRAKIQQLQEKIQQVRQQIKHLKPQNPDYLDER
jgi:hypothetical protein